MSTRFTQSEVDAYNARRKVCTPETPKSKSIAVEYELDLHDEIIKECGRRNWIALRSSPVHRTFRVEGEWDFEILADGGRFFLIECKSRDGVLSPAQRGLHAWATKLGHRIFIVRSFREFIEAVDQTNFTDAMVSARAEDV